MRLVELESGVFVVIENERRKAHGALMTPGAICLSPSRELPRMRALMAGATESAFGLLKAASVLLCSQDRGVTGRAVSLRVCSIQAESGPQSMLEATRQRSEGEIPVTSRAASLATKSRELWIFVEAAVVRIAMACLAAAESTMPFANTPEAPTAFVLVPSGLMTSLTARLLVRTLHGKARPSSVLEAGNAREAVVSVALRAGALRRRLNEA